MVSVRQIKWRTSMATQLYGYFLCPSLFKLQFIWIDYTENLRSQFFQVTQRLITDQTEITGLATIDWQQVVRTETTLLIDRAVQFATAKTNVFSDSVLCLGGISIEPVKAWESKIKWFLETRYLKHLDRIDGEPMESERNSRRDSKDDDWIKVWTRATQRKDHLRVTVRWHWLEKTRKEGKLYCVCSQSSWVCSEIHAMTMVVSGAWIREEMVRNSCQAWWRMGDNFWGHDAQLCRKRTSYIPCYQPIRKRRSEKQRKRSENHSLQRWWWHHCFDSLSNYFRQSAQCLRSSSGFVWRISQRLTRYGETRREWESGNNGDTDRISNGQPWFSD